MVDPLDPVQEGVAATFGEGDVHDVALRRRDDHALDPRLPLEVAHVGAHELHGRPAEGEVERPRVGGVGEKEADDGPALHFQRVFGFPVHEHGVAEAAHERVRGALETEGDNPVLAHEQVVEHHDFFPVDGAEVVGIVRPDHEVAGQPEVLLDVLAVVGMVPVEAGVGEMHGVAEALARGHDILRQARDTVEAVIEPQSVPVDRGRPVDAVREIDRDRRVLGDPEEGPGNLSVEAVAEEFAAPDAAAHVDGIEGERVAVGEFDQLAGDGRRRSRLPSHHPATRVARPAEAP